MKKIHLATLFLATALTIPTISLPSLAEGCSVISSGILEVKVKNNDAKLREKPDRNSKKGIDIKQGDKLTLVSNKPQDANGICWYNVTGSDNKNYWIAQSSIETKVDSQTDNLKSPPADAEDKPSSSMEIPWQLWLALALGGIGSLSGLGALIFSFLGFSKQETQMWQIRKDIEHPLKEVSKQSNQNKNQVNTLNNQSVMTERNFSEISNQLKYMGERLQLLELRLSSPPSTPPQRFDIFDSSVTAVIPDSPSVSKLIDEMISRFNQQDRTYFRDSRFQPLSFSKSPTQGQIGEDGNRMVQLESTTDVAQSPFLTISLDRENWLVPNAASPYVGQFLNNLEEYPEIFIITSGSGNLRLIKPAKLKQVTSGIWEIENPGEFQR